MKSKRITKYILTLFLLFIGLLASVAFVRMLSYSTSTIYMWNYGGDSAQFQTIGWAWANNRIPYRDMFDHKGPVIFFVDMLGYSISGNSGGILFIQIPFLFFTLLLVYQICRLASGRLLYALLAELIYLCAYSWIYTGGNMTEEYCLPFVMLCSYLQVKYLSSRSAEHPAFHAAVYGFSFGVCFLTRVTNAITICAGVLVICILLLWNRNWRCFFRNAAAFIAGFCAIFLPFAVYFASQGAFGDFIYGTIGFNIEYQVNMSSWLLHLDNKMNIYNFFLLYTPFYLLVPTIILAWKRKAFSLSAYYFLCLILESFWYFSGALFLQYSIISLTQIVFFLNELMLLRGKKQKKDDAGFCLVAAAAAAYFVITCRIMPPQIQYHYKTFHNFQFSTPYHELIAQIPYEERDSFIAYGDNDLKDVYLINGILPCCKYFAIQEWHSSFSEKVRDEIYDTFARKDAKWILTNSSCYTIRNILLFEYDLVDKIDDYCLYHVISGKREYPDGWNYINGYYFLFENGERLGTEGRGLELYLPETDSWVFLDASLGGAKATDKDVYLETGDGGGKWVHYDSDGNMVKGWWTSEYGTYYFDPETGAMTKGSRIIDGRQYRFDLVTGLLAE